MKVKDFNVEKKEKINVNLHPLLKDNSQIP